MDFKPYQAKREIEQGFTGEYRLQPTELSDMMFWKLQEQAESGEITQDEAFEYQQEFDRYIGVNDGNS